MSNVILKSQLKYSI